MRAPEHAVHAQRGTVAPGTWTSAATWDALRPSRSTSTSISTGPGGTGARKIAFAVTSGISGRSSASCIARNAVYMLDAAEDVRDAPAVGDVGVEPSRAVGIGRQRRVGAQVPGGLHPEEPTLRPWRPTHC